MDLRADHQDRRAILAIDMFDVQEKRPVWLGAATMDRGVGVSHYTGAITHHIDADLTVLRALRAGDALVVRLDVQLAEPFREHLIPRRQRAPVSSTSGPLTRLAAQASFP